MNLIVIQFLTLFYTVLSLDINLPHLHAFPHIENEVGVHNLTLSHRTPPSTRTTTWYILLNNGQEDSIMIGNGCPDNSSICAITKVDLNNGEDSIITEIFSVDQKYTRIDSFDYGTFISWDRIPWGDLNVDVSLELICSNNDFDNTESLEYYGMSDGDVASYNSIRWNSQSFCKHASGKGWGFFSILILVSTVALAGYLITQAWFNISKMGSSSDFFNELMDTVVENFSKIPQFVGEVIQKISGSRNSNRGGYSAV